ncbi:ABC transporter substrate-binding protein [Roseococcus sp. SYP-B2431]|uniref:ABC transporter substrate-binding protein n=1 Tax=Roseococcus sp. SYP-B2431 TaxID=2496640 RepID=UPI001F100DC7|nr:ABC transporter substrate-binding protein [Roseococcus sp. SYP-B2431]
MSAAHAQPERPLRLVMNTELQVLDPIMTTAFSTRTFSYMVFDTLVAVDSRGEMRPQMLDSWEISTDRLTYTFRLRPGLEWSDGRPVTAEDCIASLRRWGARDGLGRQLMQATKDLTAVDASTFRLELKEPFGQVIEALGKTAMLVPFMMPARIANTPATTQITEIVGSGPYLFVREEWRPGDRVVFRRNPRYRPRSEPADGLAGGKVVHIERVEFVSIPDASTKVNALLAGEVDLLERAPPDFLARLRRDRRVTVTEARGAGLELYGALALNHLQPPFNNIRIRQALQLALRQPEIVAALGFPDNMVHQQCLTLFLCGGPYATDAGGERFAREDLPRARQMLQEAGYNNERVVVLHASDSALIDPIGLVAIEQMRRLGLNLDVRITDWATVSQLRNQRGPTGEGGWSALPLVWTGFDMANPMTNPVILYNCSDAFPGWWCDQRQVPLLREFAAEPDMARRRELAARIQELAREHVNLVTLGQFASPATYRADLQGVIEMGVPVMWNIRRAQR